MRICRIFCFSLIFASVWLCAESKNPADYPLRIHIFGRREATFYHNRALEETRGDGRANLFENSEVRGVDFSFSCSQNLRASIGFETYPARWKKPNQELIVLFPVFGKPNSYFTCHLKTVMKDYAYFMHNGRMGSEPAEQYRAWMKKHDYDPEHGKNMPVGLAPSPASADTTQ